jgi:multiple sugar transport system permease protein
MSGVLRPRTVPMTLRRTVLVGLIGLLVLALAPRPVLGGWIEDRDGKTIIHLKLWQLPDPSRTDTATRADVAAVREFVRRFPKIFAAKYRDEYQAHPERYGRHNWDNIEIELHQFSGIEVEGVETALLAIAGNASPDVMYVNFRQSDSYIQQGFLYPLDLPEDEYVTGMTEEAKDFRIHEKIWPVIRRIGPGGEKHVWAIPYGGALGKVCWYRKDLFDAGGVPYPENDWTWEDFYEAAKAITDPANGIYGVRFGRGKHESWYWITFLWSAGGEVMTYHEPSDTWTAEFDSREAAVALDFYTRLCTEPWEDEEGRQRYGYAYKETEANIKWERGEIGMMFAYIDEKLFAQINPDVTGMVPVPIGPTGTRGAELNSRMMGLFAGIKNPVIRDAAWEYVRWYDCKDAVRIKTRIMVEGGLGRFVNPRYLRMFGYEELIRLAPKGWSEIFEIAINTGKPEPYGRDSNYAYDIMTVPLQRAEEMALAGELPEGREERLDVLHGLLETAVKKANEQMLGIVPPQVRRKRRITAVFALIAIVVAFALVFRKVVRAFTPPALPGQKKPGWEFGRYKMAYLLILPAALSILVWKYVPLVRGSVMAFMDYKIMGGSSWVWLDNFGDVLWSAEWWAAIFTSLRYSLLVIALTFLPPVILAILLQEVPRGKLLFRTIFYLPAVITGLVVILLWKSFYDPSENGVLNSILMRIPAVIFVAVGLLLLGICLSFARRLFFHGATLPALLFLVAGALLLYTPLAVAEPIFADAGVDFWAAPFASVPRVLVALVHTLPEPYRWLSSSDTALFCCVLPMVWAGMGPGCLIYLAALKGIADDFYEAADVDGATFIDKVLFIIFPILKPLLIIQFVGVFIRSWKSTANILAMTGGGYGTEVAGLHIFYKAFIFLKFGPATAMAWTLGFLLIGFTVHQLTILSRLEFRTTGGDDKK